MKLKILKQNINKQLHEAAISVPTADWFDVSSQFTNTYHFLFSIKSKLE